MADGKYTNEQLTALTDAIARGVLRVEYAGGNLVMYQNLNEMRSLRNEMIAELKSQGDGIPSPNAFRSTFAPR